VPRYLGGSTMRREPEPDPVGLDGSPRDDSQRLDHSACRRLEEVRARATCSIDEASAILGIGRSTAYAAARDGSLPTLRLSHRLLVPTSKLLAMLGYEDSDRRPQ